MLIQLFRDWSILTKLMAGERLDHPQEVQLQLQS